MGDEVTSEPSTATILELFSRDPLDLGKQDIDAIVAKMRAQRAAFNRGSGSKVAGRPASKQTKASAEAEKVKAAVGNIQIKLPGLG